MLSEQIEIPVIIGGQEIRTGQTLDAVCPHDHRHVLAKVHQVGPEQVDMAIKAAKQAWFEWSEMDWEARAAVFLRAAELLAGPWRATMNAASMLNQSKTVHQAEIDAACELIDFWRFNAHYMREIYSEQPLSVSGIWDTVEYRALEGFIFAVTPFNFASIGGNLPTSPALMGNTVLWKPATTSVVTNYYTMRLLEAAGLPPGVINFIPGKGSTIGKGVLTRPELAGVHFTGSTPTFQFMWKTIGDNIDAYQGYPRIVGETGGKDFIFAHASADVPSLATALVRGGFEYQGQKCSAASRAYIPESLWPELRKQLVGQLETVRMGSPVDFRNFMASVIDEAAFDNTKEYIDEAKASNDMEIVFGGGTDKSRGYFIEPTVVQSHDPRSRLMREEIFAPVLTLFVYPDNKLDETIELCDTTSAYGLTGGVFATERSAIVKIANALRHAAGNFYINDKPTGAVVGQQPFGGGRKSGTNDKAGSSLNLLRWVSQRAIKETFVPPTRYEYPFMDEK
jgi:1-pyrroline-5-carboxylate dehydrogenase